MFMVKLNVFSRQLARLLSRSMRSRLTTAPISDSALVRPRSKMKPGGISSLKSNVSLPSSVVNARSGTDGHSLSKRRGPRKSDALLAAVERLVGEDAFEDKEDELYDDMDVDELLRMVQGDPLEHLNSRLRDFDMEFNEEEEEEEEMAHKLNNDIGTAETGVPKTNAPASATSPEVSEDDELFSLQIYVEQVRVVGRDSLRGLAVVFRLLDFPALIISPSGEATFGRFEAGKSCLFRLPRGEAAQQLRKAPLYLMLVDHDGSEDNNAHEYESYNAGARLLGSTALDLSGVCGLGLMDVSDMALPGPSSHWGWRRGRFPLMDLMGNQVAIAVVRVRLCNFGDTLLPHLLEQGQQKALVIGSEAEQQRQEEKVPMKNIPVPVELLQTMQKLDEKVGRLEQQLQRSTSAVVAAAVAACKPSLERHSFAPLLVATTSNKENRAACNRWLPVPGADHVASLPPPMYLKKEAEENDVGSSEISEQTSLPQMDDKDFALLTELVSRFRSGDEDVVYHLASALCSGRSSKEKFEERDHMQQRPLQQIGTSRNSTIRISNPGGDNGDPLRSRRDSVDSEIAFGKGRWQIPREKEAKKEKERNPRRVLRVRKNRAQIMREQANRRKYFSNTESAVSAQLGTRKGKGENVVVLNHHEQRMTSSTKDPNAASSVGLVQITADLGRSRVLAERETEERIYIRDKQAARRAKDAGKMQLSTLIDEIEQQRDPNAVLGAKYDDDDRGLNEADLDKKRIRTAQLDLMWRGKMPLQPAYEHHEEEAHLAELPKDDVGTSSVAAIGEALRPHDNDQSKQTQQQQAQRQQPKQQKQGGRYFQPSRIPSLSASISSSQQSSRLSNKGDTSLTSSLSSSSSLRYSNRQQQQQSYVETTLQRQQLPGGRRQRPGASASGGGSSVSSRSVHSSRKFGAKSTSRHLGYSNKSEEFGAFDTFVIDHLPEVDPGLDGSYDAGQTTATSRYHDFDQSRILQEQQQQHLQQQQ